MAELEQLRKRIEEKKKKEKKYEGIDLEEVDKIVERVKKKYSEEGVELEGVSGRLKELRGIIAEGKQAKLEVQTVEDLKAFRSPLVRDLGKFYLSAKAILKPLESLINLFPQMKQLSFYLYSANMRYSAKQYAALITAVTAIVFVFSLALSSLVVAFLPISILPKILIIILVSIIAAFMTIVVGFLVPRRNAQQRGDAISRELPFALRHMATELKAGIGLYRTIQTIAVADYGFLSEEFARAITEIEEGTDTKLALRHLALRTQSRALRNAMIHVIRALTTGGNLSEVMNDIADDVSFELRMKIRDFGEKMNFFGVIYIYLAIVVPVFITILGMIKVTPMETGAVFQALPLDPITLAIFYLLIMPFILVYLIVFVSMSQPKV